MCNLVNDKGIDAIRFVTTFCVLSFLRVVTLFIHQFSFYFIVFSLQIISWRRSHYRVKALIL